MQADVFINEKAIRVLIEDKTSKIIRKVLPAIRLEMQRRFKLPKSGKFYSRGKSQGGGRAFRGGGRYRASAKGEAPAIRSGRLFNSIKESYPDKLTGVITVDTHYAAYLEPPAPLDRPFALVSVETVVERFNQSLRF
jgi:hypothetical protein